MIESGRDEARAERKRLNGRLDALRPRVQAAVGRLSRPSALPRERVDAADPLALANRWSAPQPRVQRFSTISAKALDTLDALEGEVGGIEAKLAKFDAGQDKRAKFPTSKAPISAVFHSFRLDGQAPAVAGEPRDDAERRYGAKGPALPRPAPRLRPHAAEQARVLVREQVRRLVGHRAAIGGSPASMASQSSRPEAQSAS